MLFVALSITISTPLAFAPSHPEYGVSPTSAGLPIIESSLEGLVPEWNMINEDQTSSEWIDSILQSQGDSSGEKTETIRSDQQEIKFAFNNKGGFVELIITQKIN